MRKNILDWMDELGNDLEHVVIVTHNIDFLFVENVIVPRLRGMGEPSLTIFADAASADSSYRGQSALLSYLGRRYRVVAIDLGNFRRFHPKAVLACKKQRANLIVGSGNLTAGGFGGNYEVWSTWGSEAELAGPLSSFIQLLKRLPHLVPMPQRVNDLIDKVEAYPWAVDLPERGNLLDSLERPLLDQIIESITAPILELVFAVPYFDPGLVALRRLAQRCDSPVKVLMQPGRAGMSVASALTLPKQISLVSVSPSAEREQARFMHAKFYMARTSTDRYLLVGSANCSQAALLNSPDQANAELLTCSKISDEDWFEFANELAISDELPSLPEAVVFDDDPDERKRLRIVGAKFESGWITIDLINAIGIVSSRLNAAGTEFRSTGNEKQLRIEFAVESPMASLFVRGYAADGNFTDTAVSWVDDEELLGMSSPVRRMQRKLSDFKANIPWATTDYSEILEIFSDHLKDETSRLKSTGPGESESDKEGQYSYSDIFAAECTSIVKEIRCLPEAGFDDADALRALLSLMGIVEEKTTPTIATEDNIAEEDRTDEDTPGSPLLPKADVAKPQESDLKAIEKQQRRFQKAVRAIEAAVAEESFVRNRPPARLAADLGALGLLLRKALADGALTSEEFGLSTARIWKAFFVGDGDVEGGTLIRLWRSLSTEERVQFQKGMQDPRLASTLTIWFFPDWPGEEYKEWFDLSISLVCSVMPWLLQGSSIERTLIEVNRIKRRLLPKSQVDSVEKLWLRWVRNGAALRHLEELFAGVKQSQLAGDRPGQFVEPGELLWQGGLCISLYRTELKRPFFGEVRYLGTDKQKKIRGDFLYPVSDLFQNDRGPIATHIASMRLPLLS